MVNSVTGAGDTVIATLTLALAAGAGLADAGRIANYAAGLVVMKAGTATVSQPELLAAIRSAHETRHLNLQRLAMVPAVAELLDAMVDERRERLGELTLRDLVEMGKAHSGAGAAAVPLRSSG